MLLLPVAPVSPAEAPPGPVSSDPVTSFRLPHAPSQADTIFQAPDGSFWFGAANGLPGGRVYVLAIERISPVGEISQIADHLGAKGFAKTADGNIWFTGSGYIGRYAPDGTLAKFPTPESASTISHAEAEIVVGSDGNLWFSGSREVRMGSEGTPAITVDRMTPGGNFTEFDLPGIKGTVTNIAAGPDGNVWFTATNSVGRISPSGQIAEFQLPQYYMPTRIAAGPDGNVWFTEEAAGTPAVGRVTPSGEITQFLLPKRERAAAIAIAPGPDGRVWFSYEPGVIGRIASDGSILWTPLPDPTYVTSIVTGSEGSVWYTAAGEPSCADGDEACRTALPTAAAIVGRIEPILPPAQLEIRVGPIHAAHHGRTAKVRLSCLGGRPGDACHGRIRLRSGGAAIGKHVFRLATGRTRGFSLALAKKAREKLQLRGGLKVLCATTLDDGRAQKRTLRLHVRPLSSGRRSKHPVGKNR